MGDRDVDRIIEQWRAEARAAGESAPAAPAAGRLRAVVGRIGWLRIAAGVAAVVVFAAVAVPLLSVDQHPVAAQPSPMESPGAAPPVPEATAAQPVTPDWFAIMQGVDAARAAAYSGADGEPLAAVFAADGPALGREQASVAALAAGGVRAVGWRTEILSVRVVDAGPEQVRIGVSDLRGAYDLVDAQGATTTVPAADRASWLVDLRKQADAWVVVDAAPDDAATSPPAPP